ncbi:UDP-N-acetylglucosamine 1-carboxyvinyltransferase [Cellulosilyticum ruminicola]|uniref:UDP-N-acetylglucosamine 1-carboxyvinyltransferase n=1 Tax=Cellulosilyticum ruminicola TaxID=425254 RepID=UPI0006D282BA|nr:UDP-N-acetylglucosamine 1-carboxyvinyltransferase [Cellulosilyticum ruminicola]
MSELYINGGKRLVGEVTINGAKNAAVAILPAALLVDGVSVIENLPYIDDVQKLKRAMEDLGAVATLEDKHTLTVDGSTLFTHKAVNEYVGHIRASYYLIGALLGRFKEAEVAMPGGCDFGGRPIDQHIKGFEALGATVTVEDGVIKAHAEKLVGTDIYLDVVSVGATINVMLAATLAEGTTTIENAAKEPHVVDVANFLNMMGANIKGAGTDVIRIKGVERLNGGRYSTIPDQIEAGTYMMAAAITGGDVYVRNIIPEHMYSVSLKMMEMGITIEEGDDYIHVVAPQKLKATNIKTLPHPGFPTDLQPQMATLLSIAEGTSTIIEGVWDNRFQYIDELKKTGADITVEGRTATVQGVPALHGTSVKATDLRAGAALVLAGLRATDGPMIISNVRFIDRGYEALEEKLTTLGADIIRKN